MERNLHDALGVAKNIFSEPKLVPGGGAVEMELSKQLLEKSKEIQGLEQKPFKSIAYALEAIPRILGLNCGSNVVRLLTELRVKHQEENGLFWGIDGNKGVIADMREAKVWEPLMVKRQIIKTAIESSCMLLRIDDIVSGIKKKEAQGSTNFQDQEAMMN